MINVTPDDFIIQDSTLYTSHAVSQAFTHDMFAAFLFGLLMGAAFIIVSYSFDEFVHESLVPWLSKKLRE